MAFSTAQGRNLLRGFKFPGYFDDSLAKLPPAYKKFWKEWKETQPAAVHYIPNKNKWERNPVTNEVKMIQNVPLPLRYPKQHNNGLWGGEAVVQGFQKRHDLKQRIPHFWVPVLHRTVVYSEVMDKYMSTIVTQRTMELIHANYGLDHYILKTLACDLKSNLAVNLKRRILLDLKEKCPAYADDPVKQKEIYNAYKEYLTAYTDEDLEWYGLTLAQALRKQEEIDAIRNQPVPLKHKFRLELIEKLKNPKINQTDIEEPIIESGSWLSKISPFSKQSN